MKILDIDSLVLIVRIVSQEDLGARAIFTLKVFDKICKRITKETKIVGITHVNGANNLSLYYSTSCR